MSGVAFFDLDRTLLDVNSAHLWLREEWRAGRVGVRVVGRALWWFGRYALGDAELDQAMEEAAAIYRGVREAEMEANVSAWFDREIRHRARPGALDAIRAHRAAGDRVVLATSSSQFAARCAQQVWSLDDTVSTVVRAIDGVLDGTIAVSGFGRHKLTRCAEWAAREGIDLRDAAFYTDSYSDTPLLEQVGRPVVVNPDRRLRRTAQQRGWPVVDWGLAAAAPSRPATTPAA